MRRTHLLGMLAAAAACSTPNGTISLILGPDDPFMMTPLPTRLDINAVDEDGGVTQLAQAALPTSTIDLGGQSYNNTDSLEAVGYDDAGTEVLWGEALPIQLGSIEGTTLPIFVQRTGMFSRMPNPLSAAFGSPLVTMLDGRFIVAVQGFASQIYDLANWTPLTSPPSLMGLLTDPPTSIAVVGTQTLLLNSSQAIWFDFSDGSTSTPTPPSGLSIADVAGGSTVTVPTDGTQFIVGATRLGVATTAILVVSGTQVDSNGLPVLTSATLATPRQGAAATWINGSLVVCGGSGSSDPMANGIEVLPEADMSPINPPPFPPDTTTGAGATALDDFHVLLVGGLTTTDAGTSPAPTRLLTLNNCSSNCAAVTNSWPTPAVALVSTQAFTFNANNAFVVGNDASGVTHAYNLVSDADAGTATEIPFKSARNGASALQLPMGPVAVVGGSGSVMTIESFTP